MTTVLDSQIFHNIFSTEECASIWSDKTRTLYYLQFEAALAKAQAQLGIIPDRAANEIVRHCHWEKMDVEQLRKQTELIGYPVLPMVNQLVARVNAVEERLGEWAHWGATTQARDTQRVISCTPLSAALGSHRYSYCVAITRYFRTRGNMPQWHHKGYQESMRKA